MFGRPAELAFSTESRLRAGGARSYYRIPTLPFNNHKAGLFHALSFPQADADYQPCGFQTAPLPEVHCFFTAREPRLKEVPYASLRRSLDVHAFRDGPLRNR